MRPLSAEIAVRIHHQLRSMVGIAPTFDFLAYSSGQAALNHMMLGWLTTLPSKFASTQLSSYMC